jgi:NitT/TauT family transport system ATP-binding protein
MLEVEHLSKSYGHGESKVHAVGDLTFNVVAGEFVCIVGPSGCGKTTLLKVLCGLLPATSGTAVVDGTRVDGSHGPPDTLALVFQEYTRSLLPWMSVEANVSLPLRAKRIPAKEREERTRSALDAVGLAHSLHQYPWQLSGGMQQRVAIARALAYQPKILLMDEPFASVDAQTRADLEDLILRVRDEFDITVLFVTHDIDESVYLADRVLVLSPSPTSIVEEIPIPLARPRDQVTTKEEPEFARLRGDIFRLIKRSGSKSADAKPAGEAQPMSRSASGA